MTSEPKRSRARRVLGVIGSVVGVTVTFVAATATAATATLLLLRLSGRSRYVLRRRLGRENSLRLIALTGGVFVCHHQNSSPPSRAASASAFTRP